jgi:signal transduction histidine kinase
VFKIRCLGVLLIGLYYAATYTDFYRRHEQLTTGCLALFFGVSLVWAEHVTGYLTDSLANIALILVIFPTAFRLRSTAALISSLGTVIFTRYLTTTESLPANLVFANDLQLGGGVIVSVVFAWLNEFYNRRTFELEVRLERQKEQTGELADQVRAAKEERTRWLESLAGFLRHELKNQLVGIRTSIDLAKRTIDDQKGEPYLSRAHRSTDVMQRLLAAATEATTLEAALSTKEFSRVNLAALVLERCGEFEPIAGTRELLVSAGEPVAVRGDHARLVQLLDKLLGNACDHGGVGSPIRVRVAASGPRAALEVQNEGVLPTDRSHLFEPFESHARGARCENLGIGLYVAKLIAESHGGTISAQEPSPGQVVMRVELPRA